MRILAAFDKCKDSLNADELCSLSRSRIEAKFPDATVREIPQTDGGEGFASILTRSRAGRMRPVRVSDSLGRPHEVEIGVLEISSLGSGVIDFLGLPQSGTIALVEMASSVGLSDLSQEERDPWSTGTRGVGECLLKCAEWGVDAILLGIGGSSTNDMGVGALRALGARFLDEAGEPVDFPSPRTWERVESVDASGLSSLPPVIVACDVSNPLLGENGATRRFGPQKGLREDDLERMEAEMTAMSGKLEEAFTCAGDLRDRPGTGAAGGIGFGLSLACEVSMVEGFPLVCEWFDLESEIRACDLVLTGEGRFDSTSLQGKGPCEILRLAEKFGKKAILFAGSVEEDAVACLRQENDLIEVREFGRPELSLEENLARGSEFFADKLDEVLDGLASPTEEKELRFRRIRRVKRLMRRLPRRSNVHRYPVLKWFSKTAYERSYLWSFRSKAILPAIFLGTWVALLPIVGIQMLVVFFIALWARANLPVIVALQWISNPITMGPIYYADYKIGMALFGLIGIRQEPSNLLSAQTEWSTLEFSDLLDLIDTFPPMFLGGSILGISLGVLAVFLYKGLAKLYKSPTTERQ